ncbi:MAG TPA: polysaccharide deacetylase family protein [bacterium]|jgi:peptidoglycan/xylan/chitin deacetylase (PgdA/CDA1 family)|nr:polysaccharide deacetylase family protein [bacterium]
MSWSMDRIKGVSHFPVNALRNLWEAPLLVLGYHRIANFETDPFGITVTPEAFRRQLVWLAENFDVIGAEDIMKPRRRPAIMLTFDDGYSDNVTGALPVLHQMRLPALLFLATGYVNRKREFLWDALERILSDGNAGRRAPLVYRGIRLLPEPGRNWMDTFDRLWDLLQAMSPSAQARALREISGKAGVPARPRPSHRIMSLGEVRSWASTPGMSVGGHTRSHFILAGRPPASQRSEVRGSYLDLRRWGLESPYFAYPNGQYDQASILALKDSGYRFAFTTRSCAVRRSTSPWELPRMLVGSWTLGDFKGYVRRAFVRGWR